MRSLAFVLIALVALVSGCESVSTRVQDRFSGVPPQVRYYAADSKDVYDAGIKAVKSLELNLGRTSRSNGTIEAYNSIRAGDAIHDTRQTSMRLQIFPADGGETKVELLVTEATEGSFPGGVSEQQLRVHSLYELYFGALQRQLLEAGTLKKL
ncbi:hypothetical protein [Oleiharenicola lentus]|uniref:hypothetical protein n=1 Tax=Oleiharenicola lentus TaxID=2508720 RepID=UPI003F672DE3